MLHDAIDSASYMAHGYCLLWKPWLVAVHAASDILIFASYFAIPSAIWIFLRHRPDLAIKPLAVLFAGFIFLCGLTHLIQFATLWWPIYETQGYVKIATAVVSVSTATAIFPLIPKAVAIPSPAQLQRVNDGLALEVQAHRETLSELERAKEELERRVAERTRELALSHARFEALVKASAQVVWTANATGEIEEDSPSWRAFTGQSASQMKGTGWIDAIHPDDQAATLAAWREAINTRGTYSVEYRVSRGGQGWHWMHAKGVPLATSGGAVREWVGMNVDIDERRRAEDHTQFIMRELSHRTKNLLAVVYSMARQSSKYASSIEEFVTDFGARIQGLSRSHNLLVSRNWKGVPLKEHFISQLQPFAPADSRQIRANGPDFLLRPEATQALGLAFHELATNAAKYGALNNANGEISVDWEIGTTGASEKTFKLTWREHLPRAVEGKPMRQGFGTVVLNRVVPETLAGKAYYLFDGRDISWQIVAPLSEVEAAGEPASGTVETTRALTQAL